MNLVAKQVTPQELHQLAMDYYRSLGTVGKKVEDYRDLANNSYAMSNLRKWIFNFIQKGILLAQAVLGTKEPPASQKKAFELAVRLFMSAGRGPNKGVAWFDKNLPLINLLYDAATQWPDKAEGEAKFTVGPFTVHNVIGLSGDELEGTKDALKKAALLLKGLSVPGIEKVLYGDVMLVAKLAKGTHVAWYYPNEDVVYLRPFRSAGTDELLSIIHELGHRYTHKFVDKTTWHHWRRYHANLAWQRADVKTELPKVGEALPFLLKGIKGQPVVQKIEVIPPYPQPIYFFAQDKVIPERELKTLMDQQAAKLLKYPTAYSAKSDDEHFCEALSLRATGKLKEPHLSTFKTIIEDGQEYQVKMAGTYVQIGRDELEDWLDSLPMQGRWRLKQGKAGIYLLPLSENVAVKLSSTIGTSDDAMGRGMASMQLSLVSLVTNQTLNKKAQGQGHFKRTINWRKTWREGFDRMKEAYLKAQGFYDALALIEDRDQYKADLLKKIEAVPNWQSDNLLADFHARVVQGGILTLKQLALLDKAVQEAKKPQAPAPEKDTRIFPDEDPMLPVLRALWKAAKIAGDQWLMEFTKSVADQIKAGRKMTQKQMDVIEKNRGRYKVARNVVEVGDIVQIRQFGEDVPGVVQKVIRNGMWPYEGMSDDHPGAIRTDLAVVKPKVGPPIRVPMSYFRMQHRVANAYLRRVLASV